jgi:putative transport protein
VVGVFARAVLKLNYMAISGLVAGSMTDPPALAFASNISRSDAPTVSYATVYPLTMVLRILSEVRFLQEPVHRASKTSAQTRKA